MAMAPFPKRMLLVLLAIKWGDAVSEKEIYFPFFRPSWKMSPLLQRNPAIPSIVRKIKLYNEAATCRMARRKHPHSLKEQILNDLWPTNGQEWPMVKSIGSHRGDGHRGKDNWQWQYQYLQLVLISSKFWPRVASILGLMGGGVAGGREAWQEQIVPWSTPTHESSFLHVLARKPLHFLKDNRNQYVPPQHKSLLFSMFWQENPFIFLNR